MRMIMMAATAALALSAPARADTVTDWWELGNKFWLASMASPAPSTPDTQRASTRAALAMFEAVNAIDRRYQSYLNFPLADPTASQDAAAATAAYKVLLQHHPANKSNIEESYAMVMAELPDGAAKQAGVAIGEEAAAAAMGAGGLDPAIEQTPYRPRTVPGEWIGASPPTLEPYWLAFEP